MTNEELSSLPPRERLLWFVRERESIRLKREAGEPKPWTDNPILRSFRFCNVRRMDDRVSRWLLDNWYEPNRGHRNVPLACAMARWINLPETLEEVGFPRVWNPAQVYRVLKARADRGDQIVNAAYVIPGEPGKAKVWTLVYTYMIPFAQNPPRIDTDSMENTWKALCERRGLGSFMAGQVVADMRWAIDGRWLDRNNWAPKGPGSSKGLNAFLGRDADHPMNQDEFLTGLRQMMAYCRKNLPASITGRLEAHDLQSVCCEMAKVERTLAGGRPKQYYPGE